MMIMTYTWKVGNNNSSSCQTSSCKRDRRSVWI